MNPNDAGNVADFAKQLFPVTSQERINSLGVLLLEFPDPDFAKKLILDFSHEAPVNALDLPTIRNRLNAELHRRGVFRDSVMREVETRAETRRIERKAADDSLAAVNAVLNDFTADDLADLKASAIKALPEASRPFYERMSLTSPALRSVMFAHLNPNVHAS